MDLLFSLVPKLYLGMLFCKLKLALSASIWRLGTSAISLKVVDIKKPHPGYYRNGALGFTLRLRFN